MRLGSAGQLVPRPAPVPSGLASALRSLLSRCGAFLLLNLAPPPALGELVRRVWVRRSKPRLAFRRPGGTGTAKPPDMEEIVPQENRTPLLCS